MRGGLFPGVERLVVLVSRRNPLIDDHFEAVLHLLILVSPTRKIHCIARAAPVCARKQLHLVHFERLVAPLPQLVACRCMPRAVRSFTWLLLFSGLCCAHIGVGHVAGSALVETVRRTRVA